MLLSLNDSSSHTPSPLLADLWTVRPRQLDFKHMEPNTVRRVYLDLLRVRMPAAVLSMLYRLSGAQVFSAGLTRTLGVIRDFRWIFHSF